MINIKTQTNNNTDNIQEHSPARIIPVKTYVFNIQVTFFLLRMKLIILKIIYMI